MVFMPDLEIRLAPDRKKAHLGPSICIVSFRLVPIMQRNMRVGGALMQRGRKIPVSRAAPYLGRGALLTAAATLAYTALISGCR